MTTRNLSALLLLIALSACSDDPQPSQPPRDERDAGAMAADVGKPIDGSESVDSGRMDAGDLNVIADMGEADLRVVVDLGAGVDLSEEDGGAQFRDMMAARGFGAISGSCQVLEQMDILAKTPLFVTNTLDFMDMPFSEANEDELTPGGKVLFRTKNAGGSSELSELFAYEMLARCEAAVLLKTETMIEYEDPPGPITDILVKIEGLNVGVSVVRAFIFMDEAGAFPEEEARRLSTKKLEGILASSKRVKAPDAWTKQILHIICADPRYVPVFKGVWEAEISAEVKADTIVIVTATDGEDMFLYR